MIRETNVDRAVNRLSSHFEQRLVIRPPASASQLAELERMVGPLPRELVIFLSTCNGLRVDAEGYGPNLHLWSTHEMEMAICSPPGPAMPPGFLAVSGDLTGECDCIVLDGGPVRHALVRWDPWASGAALIGSSFGRYLDHWVGFLVEHFDPDGHPKSGNGPVWGPAIALAVDPDLRALQAGEDVQAWLARHDEAVASGADFE